MQNEILVIDNDILILKLNSFFVNKNELYKGFKFLSFSNNDERINYLFDNNKNNRSFLLLLDVDFPTNHSWEFLDVVSQEGFECDIKVILTTSFFRFHDMEKAKSYPKVIAFASKPLSKVVLLKVYNFIRGTFNFKKVNENGKLHFL